jgi:hypothetical protein
MFQLHNIQMPDGGGPQWPDRLTLASILNLLFPASAAALGTVGAVTAGTGYTFTPTITPTGGTVTPQVLTGGQVTTPAGKQAVVRAVMKVISAAVVSGGTGYVNGEVVAFGNGVFLTATVVSGAVTAWAVTQAGAFTNPGGLPGTALTGPASQISSSGVGVGATATLTWGIGSAVIDDSGNYSVIPTGFSVTPVDGNGSGGAVAAGAAATAGNPTFLQVGPFVNDGLNPAPAFGALGVASTDIVVELNAKVNGYASLKLQPRLAANTVVAGTLDAVIWA